LCYKHDHPLAGHFGQNKTIKLVRHEYTWPGLRTFVKEYVQSCTAWAWAKTPRHRPYGLLKQLPVPEKPWNSISMDFIEQLPPLTGFTAILVVIDQLSKQAIFIPTYDSHQPRPCHTIPTPCVLQAWSTGPCYFRLGYRICILFLLLA